MFGCLLVTKGWICSLHYTSDIILVVFTLCNVGCLFGSLNVDLQYWLVIFITLCNVGCLLVP